MTSADLRDLFLATLVKEAGGNRRRWRIVLGDVRVYSRDTHAHCNWSVSPSGNYAEIAEIERVADELRGRHPLID